MIQEKNLTFIVIYFFSGELFVGAVRSHAAPVFWFQVHTKSKLGSCNFNMRKKMLNQVNEPRAQDLKVLFLAEVYLSTPCKSTFPCMVKKWKICSVGAQWRPRLRRPPWVCWPETTEWAQVHPSTWDSQCTPINYWFNHIINYNL